MFLRLPILLYQSISIALAQILSNKLRGFLTTVGLFIGVAAISAIITLITGMRERVISEFDKLAGNKLVIHPVWRRAEARRGAYTDVVFKNNAFDQMLERCPSVTSYTRIAGYGAMPISYGSRTESDSVQFLSVDPDYHPIFQRGAQLGRPLSIMDAQQARRVCLINEKLRDKLNLDRDPTGQTVEVAYFGRMLVIGMIEPPPMLMGGEADLSEVICPFTYTTARFPYPTWYSVIATAKSRDAVEEAHAEVDFYLRQKRHLKPGEEANFNIIVFNRALKEIDDIAHMLTIVASGIVGISLLVGGVGIMNIMLVSVSERTREIGLRKAVGAKPAAILLQFLVEAIVLCLLGGLLGLIGGQIITSAVGAMIPADPMALMNYKPGRDALPGWHGATGFLMAPAAIAIAFGFSVTVGLIFGMFPAIKAATLDPIDALRHE